MHPGRRIPHTPQLQGQARHRGDIAERYLAGIARLKANPFRL